MWEKSGETIKAFVYDDRIEIRNPGPMLPGTTTDDIREGRSKIRNRGIAGVLRRIRYMERFGTAWEKIGQEVDRGYPEPLLDGDGPVFTATIWPHSSFAGLRLPLSRQSGSVNGGVNGGVADLGRGNVARRRQAVLEELTSAGGLSARELSERLEVGSRTLERDLSVLREAGLVLREGPPKTSIYRPANTE
ncbi:MAG TPA: ATP-binding protein [Solirubrobacteraceae bacterium]|nr:ATP-binding protein [Solirubrobacteraceae bacterium]